MTAKRVGCAHKPDEPASDSLLTTCYRALKQIAEYQEQPEHDGQSFETAFTAVEKIGTDLLDAP
jgi:hypothetical protein